MDKPSDMTDYFEGILGDRQEAERIVNRICQTRGIVRYSLSSIFYQSYRPLELPLPLYSRNKQRKLRIGEYLDSRFDRVLFLCVEPKSSTSSIFQ